MRHRPLCFVFLILIIIISVFHILNIPLPGEFHIADAQKERLESCRELRLTGRVSYRGKNEDVYSYVLSDSYLIYGGQKIYLHNVRINSLGMKIKAGSSLTAKGRIQFYEKASNPGGFNAALYYGGENCFCIFDPKEIKVSKDNGIFNIPEALTSLRERLYDIYIDAMGEKDGGIMSAMLLGEKSSIDTETRVNYSVSGLGHLLAISGLHVGIIGAAVLALLKRLGLNKTAAAVLSSGFLYIYCEFSGSHDSSLRAFIMFTIMVMSQCLLRSYDMLSSLSLAGIILLALCPARLFEAGFQLSFGAVAGLGLILPVLDEKLKRAENGKRTGEAVADRPGAGALAAKLKKGAAEGALVWLSVNLFTVPILLWSYCEFPVYSILANVLFVPMTGLILLLGIAGGAISLVFPVPGAYVLMLPKLLIGLQDGAGAVLRHLPFSVFITGQPSALKIALYYAGLLLLLYHGRIKGISMMKKRGLRKKNSEHNKCPGVRTKVAAVLAAIMMSVVFVRPFNGFYMTFLDVGQGDCCVTSTGKGSIFMIDGGSSSQTDPAYYTILPFFKNRGISRIDGVFVTHSDIDHMNGIKKMLKMDVDGTSAVKIGSVFMPEWMSEDKDGREIESLAEAAGAETYYLYAGEKLSVDDVDIEILSPECGAGTDGNEGSLVMGIEYKTLRALMTGDIEGKAEEQLTEKLAAGKMTYNILKASHHGSKGATTEEFLKAADPVFAIISAPEKSSYGHPGKETLERIEESGAFWLQTGLCGAITVKFENGQLLAEAYK